MLKRRIYISLLLFLLAFLPTTVNAQQQYPVRATSILLPPYNLRISDYALSTEEKLQVQLLMTDLMEPAHDITLKFWLESGTNYNVIAHSAPVVTGMDPITLQPGVPVTLSNIDLRPLFELNNLTGITSRQYAAFLPQGLYRFCFQVFDKYTGRKLSLKSCATVYLRRYDPPMPVLPSNGEVTYHKNGVQNLLFQWMPRQLAPNTSYIFTLKELWDLRQSPVSGFLSSPVLWQREVRTTSLHLGMDKIHLIPGRRYAWQIQAKSSNPALPGNTVSPADNNGVYKNNGLSEIFYFDYIEPCLTPAFILAQNKGNGRTEIRWSYSGQKPINGYKVQYRKKHSRTQWNELETYTEQVIIGNLLSNTEYEYRVGSICGSLDQFSNYGTQKNSYAYSPIQFFKTLDKDNQKSGYQCGVLPEVDLSNTTLLEGTLSVNEVFMAGDFPVTVIAAEGFSGIYSGEGYVEVPYLGDTKLKVSFHNIQLNSDKQLISGFLETDYNAQEKNIVDINSGLGEFFGDSGVVSTDVDYKITEISYNPKIGKIIIKGDAGANNANDSGSGTASEQTLPAGRDYLIKDNKGNIWTVDEQGNISRQETLAEGGKTTPQNTEGIQGQGANTTIKSYTAKGISVTWDATNSKFAFDNPMLLPRSMRKTYPKVETANGKKVFVPFKAVVNGKEDQLTARLKFKQPDKAKNAKIIFKTTDGKLIPSKKQSETTYKLQLKGVFNYAEEKVIAVLMPAKKGDKQQIIGSFRLVHLEPNNIRVKLVATDAGSMAKLSDIADKTNAIYAKVGITFDFTQDNTIYNIDNYLNNKTVIASEKKRSFKKYSKEEKAINKGYTNIDNSKYVLFVTSKKPAKSGISGYMPLNRQFGYIYSKATDNTAAHELGHGVFKLEHYGKANAGILMANSGAGVNLTHIDWKQINDPKLKLYNFSRRESGELGGEIWFSPDWQAISITNSSTIISTQSSSRVIGTVPGFIYNGIKYKAFFDNLGVFQGYYKDGNDNKSKFPLYNFTIKNIQPDKKVYLFVRGDGECNKAYETTYSYAIKHKTNINYTPDNINIKETEKIKCIDCQEGKTFIDTYKDIYDRDTKKVINNIANLLCSSPEASLFFKEFCKKGYNNLLTWQKEFYNTGDWNTDKESFTAFYKAYSNYLEYYKSAKDIINTTDERQALLRIAYNLSSLQLRSLSVKERVKMLEIISNGAMTGYWTSTGDYNIEALALKIVKSFKDKEESLAFLDGLLENNTLSKLLRKVNGKLLFKGNNFTDLVFHISDLVFRYKDKPDYNSLTQLNYIGKDGKTKNNSIILWREKEYTKDIVWHSYTSKTNSDLRLTYDYDLWFDSRPEQFFRYISPYEFIGINAPQGLRHLGLTGESDRYIVMPAILLHWMTNETSNERIWNNITTGIDAGLTLFSLGEYTVAKTVMGKAFAIANIALPSIDIIINNTDINKNLSKKPYYKDFIEVWNTIYTSYAVVTGVRLIYQLSPIKVKRFVQFYNKNKSTIQAVIKNERELAKIESSVEEIRRVGGLGKAESKFDDLVQGLSKTAKKRYKKLLNGAMPKEVLEQLDGDVLKSILTTKKDDNYKLVIEILTKESKKYPNSVKSNLGKLTKKHIEKVKWIAEDIAKSNKLNLKSVKLKHKRYDFDYIHKNLNKNKEDFLYGLENKIKNKGVHNYKNIKSNISEFLTNKHPNLNKAIDDLIKTKGSNGKPFFKSRQEFYNQFAGCYKNCEPNSVKSLNKVIEDFKKLEKLDGVDLKPFIKEMMQTPDKFKAGATSLDVVNNLHKYIPRKFKNFKIVGFEELFAIEGKFRLDIRVNAIDKKGKEISILIDTKNYGNASGMFGNFKQLKAYLKKIHSFDELLIIQQKGRGFEIEQMQSAFQTALKNANKNNKLFDEVIWKNKELSKSLFKKIDDSEKAKVIFEKMITNKDDKLFKILKITE